MDKNEFIDLATSLFGDDWAYEISKRLSINPRTVRRWGGGKKPVPDAVASIMRFWGASNGQE